MTTPSRWLAVEGLALCPPVTGVGRWTGRILDHLLQIRPDLGLEICVLERGTPQLELVLASGHDPARVRVRSVSLPARAYRLAVAARIAPPVETLFPMVRGCAAILYPNFVRYPTRLHMPEVAVLYDAGFLLHPEDKPAWFRLGWRRLTQQALDSPARCVTVSHAARADLEHSFRVREALPVIYPGLDVPPVPPLQRNAVEPYALVLGTRSPRKNVEVALQAWAAMGHSAPLSLVLVGQGHQAPPGVLVTGFVSDDRLEQLLADASVLIAPSLNEGFDLPVIEAAARGVPVIASDIPVHREVLGDDWPLLFPADDPDALAALVRAVPSMRPRDVTALDRFDWFRSAEELAALLEL